PPPCIGRQPTAPSTPSLPDALPIDPNRSAVDRALGHRPAGRPVAVRRRRRRHVGDVDREALGGEGAARVGRLDGDRVAGRGLVIEQAGTRQAYSTLGRLYGVLGVGI